MYTDKMPPPLLSPKVNHLKPKIPEISQAQKQKNDLSRFEILSAKNSITRDYQANRVKTLNFSGSSYLNQAIYNTTPDRRDSSKQTTRNSNSGFESALDHTPSTFSLSRNKIPTPVQTPIQHVQPKPNLITQLSNQSIIDSANESENESQNQRQKNSSTPNQEINWDTDWAEIGPQISIKIPAFEGLGVVRRPMMTQSARMNHKCKLKRGWSKPDFRKKKSSVVHGLKNVVS